MPSLYIVATPIGNLEDITLRAIRVLGDVQLIAAEDTRITRKLLHRYDIHTPLTSYHDHNKEAKLPKLLLALANKDVALVSDAGTPCINDPGYELVQAADESGIAVIPIPGPSALTSAIAISGFPVTQFIYLGFLPRKRSQRRTLLDSLSFEKRALVVFESPHRFKTTLEDIFVSLGDRRIAIARELTKLHEDIFRGQISDALSHFTTVKGEITLVIDGSGDKPIDQSKEEVRGLLKSLLQEGHGPKESVIQTARNLRLPRRDIYRQWVEMKQETDSQR